MVSYQLWVEIKKSKEAENLGVETWNAQSTKKRGTN